MTETETETESKRSKICSGEEAAMEEEEHVESDEYELCSKDILDELDEEERRQKSVYVYMWKGPDVKIEVISIYPHQGTPLKYVTSNVKELVCQLDILRIWGYGIAALDSKLYFIGGGPYRLAPEDVTEYDYRPRMVSSNRVFVYDTISCYWSSAPSMNVARAFPTVLTYKKKIFAFGLSLGHYNGEWPWPLPAEEWAEFYDPKIGKWQPLPGTPPEELRRFSCTSWAVDERQEKVYLSLQGTFVFEYSFGSGEWSKMATDTFFQSRLYWGGTVAVISSVLFWHYFGTIYAYDFKQGGVPYSIYTLPDAVRMLGKPAEVDYYPTTVSYLVHAGSGKLCLIYKCPFETEGTSRCHTFEIRRSCTTKELTLQLLGIQYFSTGDHEIGSVLTVSSS